MKTNNMLLSRVGVCLFMLFSLVRPAQAQSAGTEEDVKQLKYLNSLYIQSYIHSDTAVYDSLLWANDFLEQSANGALRTKEECMVRFGKPRLHLIHYFFADDVEVRFITKDVAMIHAKTPYAIQNNNHVARGMSQYNDVYVRREGKWVCVSANITAIIQPQKIEASR